MHRDICLSRRIGDDAHVLEFLHAQLILHIKGTYAVHLIAEEINAVRQLTGIGIDIQQTASQGELSGLIHIVHTQESHIEERLLYIHDVTGIPHAQFERMSLQRRGIYHLLGEGLWTGNHEERKGTTTESA